MIQLTQESCPERLAPSLDIVRKQCFGLTTMAAWESGRGPWNAVLSPLDNQPCSFSYHNEDGCYLQVVPADVSIFGLKNLFEFRVAMNLMLEIHFDGKHWHNGALDAAALVRPDAYLILKADGTGVYVPMPDVTAHEILEDQTKLDREFPGLFTFA